MGRGRDKQKCVAGKPCGDYCIPKKYTCRNEEKSGQALRQRSISEAKGREVNFPALALLGGGLGGVAVVAGAAVVSKEGYSGIRRQYRENLDRNATKIPEMAKSVKAPDIPKHKDTMIFEVGGFGTPDAYSESVKLYNHLKSLDIDKGVHHEPFEYKDFNVYSGVDPKNPRRDDVEKAVNEARKLFVKTVFKDKQNPAALRLASQIMAYQDRNPHIGNTAIVSHSGGGYTSIEAENLLRRNGRDVKVLTIGTPDVGILEGSPNIKTAVSKNDEILNSTTRRGVNQESFDNVKSHGINDYFADDNFRTFVKDYLNFKKRSDSTRFDRQKCVKGKPCGAICIPKRYKCRDEKRATTKNQGNLYRVTSPQSRNAKLVNGAFKAAAVVAGSTAVSVGAYHGIRANYRAQYGKSAEEAVRRSKEIDWDTLPDYKDKKGGYLLMPGYSEALGKTIGRQVEEIMPDVVEKFIPPEYPSRLIYNEKFNVGKGMKDIGADFDEKTLKSLTLEDTTKLLKEHIDKKAGLKLARNVATSLTDPVIRKGRNDQAIDAAANLLAIRDKYMAQNDGKEPDLRAVGVSAGGIYGADTDMILKKVGVKADMIFLGSPYLGIADPQPDNIVRIFSSRDNVVGKLSGGDAAYIQDITDHKAYQKNPVVRQMISDFSTSGAAKTKTKYYEKYPYQKIEKNPERRDSSNAIARFDRKPNCTKGKPCKTQKGTTVCIPKNYTCSSDRRGNPLALNQRRMAFETPKKGSIDPEYKVDPKTGEEYTIRDLKRMAKEQSIGNYSELDKEALRARLVAHEKAPSQQKIEYKSKLVKRGVTKEAINKAFSGRGEQSKSAKKAALNAREFWKNLETIAVFAGTKPVSWGALAIGAYAAGMSLKSYENARDNYRENFKGQSREAFDKALTLGSSRGKLSRPGFKKNITFVVSNSDSESQRMIDTLDRVSEESNGEDSDRWLSSRTQHFVKFANKEGSFRETGNPVVDGISNIKNYARNVRRGKDQDAIDLASQIYGYAIQTGTGTAQRKASQRVERLENNVKKSEDRVNEWTTQINAPGVTPEQRQQLLKRIQKEKEKRLENVQKLSNAKRNQKSMEDKNPIREFMNQDKKINVIADRNSHSVKTALEIVARIDPPKGSGFPSGKDVLTQTNVTMLGTPHFGFTEKRAAQQRTIISAQDPVSMLPVFGDGGRQQWISSTRGANAVSYLQDENVREAIRETFGYYDDSTIELLRKGNTVGRRNERFTTDAVCPPHKHWVDDDRVKGGGYCRSGGYERKRTRNSLGRGSVAGTIGGLGADIERAVVKSRRLVNKAKKQKYMTRKEKFQDEARFQAQQIGILMGQGNVSKAFRNLDNALLEFQEGASNMGDKIKMTVNAIVDAIAAKVGLKRKE